MVAGRSGIFSRRGLSYSSLGAQMRRRDLIAFLGGGALAWTLSALAQVRNEPRRIGLLWPGPERAPNNVKRREAFETRLRHLGYTDGVTIQIHARYADGALDRLPALARELVALNVDVIVAVAVAASVAAREATADIPIVMVHAGDPVGAGLIESLARPGGNVTGTSSMLPDLGGKQLQLLHQLLPSARRVAILMNPTNAGASPSVQSAASAAQALGLELMDVGVTERRNFESAFARIEQSRAEGLLVFMEPVLSTNSQVLVEFVTRNRLPALFSLAEPVREGGLMSYGINLNVHYPRAADYVDKILKGTSPAHLPIEQPTNFELVLNLRTARALGVEVPAVFLALADEVIE